MSLQVYIFQSVKKTNQFFVVWAAFNVPNKIHVREKNHLLQSTICALENSKAIF